MKLRLRALLRLAGYQESGPWLTLRKGWNELIHRRPLPRVQRRELVSGYLPRVSVIVCTCFRTDCAVRAVESLLKQSVPKDAFEILVVENSAVPTGLKERLDQLCHRSGNLVGYLREETPGLSYARNAGARAARGEYLLFLDDDAAADPDLVFQMYAAFEAHPEAGVIGGQIFLDAPEGGVVTGRTRSFWSEYTVTYRRYRPVREQYEFPYGACYGVRHSVLDAAGGFDTGFGRVGNGYDGGEDTALCFQVQRLGYQVGIQPRARVIHHVDRSRLTGEHIRQTLAAGLRTTRRLSGQGLTRTRWTDNYIKSRIKIADGELRRLTGRGADQLAVCLKRWEREALASLLEEDQA